MNVIAMDVMNELKKRVREWKIAFFALLVVSAATVSVLLFRKR